MTISELYPCVRITAASGDYCTVTVLPNGKLTLTSVMLVPEELKEFSTALLKVAEMLAAQKEKAQ